MKSVVRGTASTHFIFPKGRKTNRPTAAWQAGGSVKSGIADGSIELRLSDAANRAETLLEFVDPTFGIHKLRQPGEERMGVGGDADRNQTVFHSVDDFLFFRSFS